MNSRSPDPAHYARRSRSEETGEETIPCLGEASISSTSSPLTTSIRKTSPHFGRDTTPSETIPSRHICFTVDRATCPILLLLLLVFLGVVAAIFFAVGQWVALRDPGSLYNATTPDYFYSDEMEVGEVSEEMETAALMRVWEEREDAAPNTPIFRLPTTLAPIRYNIHFNLSRLESDEILFGTEEILIRCKNTTRDVIFHAAKGLQVTNPSISNAITGKIIPWVQMKQITENSSFQIVTRDYLLPDSQYLLKLDFSSSVCGNSSFTFCYRDRPIRARSPQIHSSAALSRDEKGPLWLVTKLEPAGAKWLFPCWDEPGLKAVFNVSLTHLPDVVALTNAASTRVKQLISGLTRTEHEATPPMSTYLFSLAVGRMATVAKKTRRGLRFHIWTLPQDIARDLSCLETEFALSYGVNMLERLENYWLSRYPLRKLDFVAAKSYPVGAMENWGLVIFHRDLLLDHVSEVDRLYNEPGSGEGPEWRSGERSRDEEIAASAHRYRTSKIITHELLHQWFGNLVTMDWWSDLWLSEGLTTFFVYHFVRHDFPLLADYEYTLLLEKVWRSQARDEKFALVRAFENDEEILKSFNILHLYSKGAIVCQMLWDLLGEQTLRSGLVEYLRTNAYSSVDRADLWRFLGNVSHHSGRPVNIGEIMEPWVSNPGFPAVSVTRGHSDHSILVQQMPASALNVKAYQDNAPEETPRPLWPIPFHYTALGGHDPRMSQHRARPFWLYNQSYTFIDMDLADHHVLLANPSLQFPFRVNYDSRNWVQLISILHAGPEEIPEKSRVQLLVDAELFLQDTADGTVLFYDLLTYLKHEENLVVLLTGVDIIYDGLTAYKSSPVFPLLLVLFRDVIAHMERQRKRIIAQLEVRPSHLPQA